MRRLIHQSIVISAALLIAVAFVTAQEKPAAPPAAPTVADESKKAIQALAQRDAGLADAAGVIQKERDAIAAEFARTIARIQAAAPSGYELGPNLVYVKKDPKKDPPKQ